MVDENINMSYETMDVFDNLTSSLKVLNKVIKKNTESINVSNEIQLINSNISKDELGGYTFTDNSGRVVHRSTEGIRKSLERKRRQSGSSDSMMNTIEGLNDNVSMTTANIDELETTLGDVKDSIDELNYINSRNNSFLGRVAGALGKTAKFTALTAKATATTAAETVTSHLQQFQEVAPTAQDYEQAKENLKKAFTFSVGGGILPTYMMSFAGNIIKDIYGKVKGQSNDYQQQYDTSMPEEGVEGFSKGGIIPYISGSKVLIKSPGGVNGLIPQIEGINSFAKGGIVPGDKPIEVPGKEGEPKTVTAHGGEIILPGEYKDALVNRLDKMIELQQMTNRGIEVTLKKQLVSIFETLNFGNSLLQTFVDPIKNIRTDIERGFGQIDKSLKGFLIGLPTFIVRDLFGKVLLKDVFWDIFLKNVVGKVITRGILWEKILQPMFDGFFQDYKQRSTAYKTIFGGLLGSGMLFGGGASGGMLSSLFSMSSSSLLAMLSNVGGLLSGTGIPTILGGTLAGGLLGAGPGAMMRTAGTVGGAGIGTGIASWMGGSPLLGGLLGGGIGHGVGRGAAKLYEDIYSIPFEQLLELQRIGFNTDELVRLQGGNPHGPITVMKRLTEGIGEFHHGLWYAGKAAKMLMSPFSSLFGGSDSTDIFKPKKLGTPSEILTDIKEILINCCKTNSKSYELDKKTHKLTKKIKDEAEEQTGRLTMMMLGLGNFLGGVTRSPLMMLGLGGLGGYAGYKGLQDSPIDTVSTHGGMFGIGTLMKRLQTGKSLGLGGSLLKKLVGYAAPKMSEAFSSVFSSTASRFPTIAKVLGGISKQGIKRLPGVGGLITAALSMINGDDLGVGLGKGIGATAGAAAGGAVGALLGPPGIIIGAIFGSLLGEIAGGWIGGMEWFQKYTTDLFSSFWDSIKSFPEDLINAVLDNIPFGDKIKDMLGMNRYKGVKFDDLPAEEVARRTGKSVEYVNALREKAGRRVNIPEKHKMIDYVTGTGNTSSLQKTTTSTGIGGMFRPPMPNYKPKPKVEEKPGILSKSIDTVKTAYNNTVEMAKNVPAKTMELIDAATAMIKMNEASGDPKLQPYPDAGGWSIGYGHHLFNNPDGIVSITREKAEQLLKEDIPKYIEYTKNKFPNFESLDISKKLALIDLSYNMGGDWTSKFKNAYDYMLKGDWIKGAEEIIYKNSLVKEIYDEQTKKWIPNYSKYKTQVKGRADRVYDMLTSGEVPKYLNEKLSTGMNTINTIGKTVAEHDYKASLNTGIENVKKLGEGLYNYDYSANLDVSNPRSDINKALDRASEGVEYGIDTSKEMYNKGKELYNYYMSTPDTNVNLSDNSLMKLELNQLAEMMDQQDKARQEMTQDQLNMLGKNINDGASQNAAAVANVINNMNVTNSNSCTSGGGGNASMPNNIFEVSLDSDLIRIAEGEF